MPNAPRTCVPLACAALMALGPASGRAQEPSTTGGGQAESQAEPETKGPTAVQVGGETGTGSGTPRRARGTRGGSWRGSWIDPVTQPWAKRYAPTNNLWELGVYGGALFPDQEHELFRIDLDRSSQGQLPFRPVAGVVGARVGYYPLRFLGVEAEGGVAPTRAYTTAITGRVLMWHARGHAVAQIGLWRLTPFVLAGVGALGVSSAPEVVGDDVDLGVHFGGGLKIFVNQWLMIRVEGRDTISSGCDACGLPAGELKESSSFNAHHPEVLAGLSVTLGRPHAPGRSDPPPPAESAPPPDSDGDGIPDPVDACISEPETFNDIQDDDGCPEVDGDGDGVWDRPADDLCPDEPGVPPDGCPEKSADMDGDGLLDVEDECPEQPETVNGHEDGDGCPDEVPDTPPEIEGFTGTLQGVSFDNGKAKIRPESKPVLDRAVQTMATYPELRIRVTGHTDNVGGDNYNLKLSTQRAAAVKRYLVSKGVAASRIETLGKGSAVPIDTNRTPEGRALNRRIEIEILQR